MMKTHEYIKRGDILYDIKTEKTGIYSGQCFTSYPPYWGIVDGDKISDRYCINLSEIWRILTSKGNPSGYFPINEHLEVMVTAPQLSDEAPKTIIVGEIFQREQVLFEVSSSHDQNFLRSEDGEYVHPARKNKFLSHFVLFKRIGEDIHQGRGCKNLRIGDWEGARAIRETAKIAHEINRAYCNSIGDKSQPSWENAPEWQKESATSGVRAVVENPYSTPEESHKGWMKQKIDEGWVYGPVKDPEKKIHPCMVSYSELPTEQKAKDYIFLSVAKETFNALVKAYDGR